MLITDKELHKIATSQRNYMTGQKYYNNDYVVAIDIVHYPFNDEYIITGDIDNNTYENSCEIRVNGKNEITDYGCDCYWCDEYSACGHVVAVLLKVQELSPDTFPFHFRNDTKRLSYRERILELQRRQEEEEIKNKLDVSKNIISNFKDSVSNKFEILNNPIKYDIEISLNNNYSSYELKFKVGTEKKYVIKNISQFLSAIDHNEVIKYGKQLSFVHCHEVFSEDALKIIEMMRFCVYVHEQIISSFYDYRLTNHIDINSSNIDFIYNQLESLQHPAINVYQFDYQPTLHIRGSKNYYILELEEFDFIRGRNCLYDLSDKGIGRITLDDEGKGQRLIQECQEDDELFISKEDFPDFYKYVLNDVKDYFKITGYIPSVDMVKDEKLTLYGDVDDNEQVRVYLESNQNGKMIYSFDHEGVSTSVNFDLIENHLRKISDVVDFEKHCMYLNLDSEKTYNFLNQGLPFLANYCQIMVSDHLMKLGKKSEFKITVGVSVENNLLAIDVDSIDIPSEELSAVLAAYHKKKKYHRLKNGQLLYLESDELEELDEFMNDYNLKPKMLTDGHLDMNMYRAFSIDDKADNSNHLIFNRSAIFNEVINNFRNVSKKTYDLSKYYRDTLRDYQQFGYQWLQSIAAYGFGGILADDMGLGKTLQMIALLDENRAADQTSIVICPSSLLLNWQDEIQKFSSTLTCTCVHGPLKQRKLAINTFNQVDVLITTYDYIRRDYKLYDGYEFAYIILDEAQYIKNPKTKNAIAVKALSGKHRFALTGTPIENSLAELWSIFDFLMPDYLYNYHYFQSHYETPIVKNHEEEKQVQLKQLISPFILRRTKKEVLSELPEKIEKTLTIEFNDEEHKLYLANLVQVNKELQAQLNYDNVSRVAILAMLTRLRQICCEPRIIYDNINSISSKLEGCMDLIKNFQGNKQKVLLFSSFTSVLDLIGEELVKAGISYYQLTGSTSKTKRHEMVAAFQEDDTEVFLISLKAGGTGLNLTAAQVVIHFDPWWNMSAQNQATDRAHRIGQENVVSVYKLVMKDSIEEKILELQNKKKNLADDFVENNDGSITTMSTDDIINLFKE